MLSLHMHERIREFIFQKNSVENDMAVINTNTKALFTQAALISTERTLSKSMEQLTGKRINSAGDDAGNGYSTA